MGLHNKDEYSQNNLSLLFGGLVVASFLLSGKGCEQDKPVAAKPKTAHTMQAAAPAAVPASAPVAKP